MLTQPVWVAAVVVQFKTQGGIEFVDVGIAAEAVELWACTSRREENATTARMTLNMVGGR